MTMSIFTEQIIEVLGVYDDVESLYSNINKIYEEIQARPRYFISSIQRSTKEEQQ